MGFQCIVLFLFLLSSPALAKFSPRFPSSIVRPEQLAQITNINDEAKPYETRYFTQILDHFNFNPQSYQTFQQRYLINEKYWGGAKKNAPIFVYMGNEGDIEWFAHNTGFMYENAPHFNTLLVFIEHRYYGKSIPYGGDKEVAYKNATTQGYLSSTQALADYATLILDLKNNLTASESPVVVFGGSYGGMLAAWFRLKYPHVAIGALASSSPILNFGNLTSPFTFNNIVTQDFRSESENCYEVIKESWTQIEETAKQNGGLEKLRSSFNICKNITISADDIESWLSTAYIYTAMTDYPTPSNFLNPLPAFPVKQMCKAIDNPLLGNDTFAKLYGAANIYYNYSGNLNCFDIAGDNDKHGLQEWTWQACTEMILPTDGNNKESIFPASNYSYNDRESYCTSLYGVQPRPHWITTEFGGTDIHRVLRRYGSNILFFNGIRDPWSGGGVLKSISNSLVAIIAKEESAYSLTPRQSALWKSQQGDHTSAWLRAVFISGLGQTMNAKTYRCVLSYRMGVPLFSVSTSCSACSRVFAGDIFGDHVVSCAGIVGIKHRHNVVRDTLVDVCYRSGISARKEVDIGLVGGNDEALRPADVLLYSWDRGRDVCVDLTGSSPLTQSGLSDFIPGRVVADAAHRKRVKYEARCQTIGYGFIPFSFSSLGELEREVVALLKRIQRFSTTQDIGARAAAHIFTRVGFAIARGVRAQIVSRLPTNLL